jgi:hypothetical protein
MQKTQPNLIGNLLNSRGAGRRLAASGAATPTAGRRGSDCRQDPLGESRAHGLMNGVNRLERPHHHLEAIDLTICVPSDEIGAVDVDTVDHREKLQHR